MSRIRKIAMFGGTFAVALGIGFVMQNGDALAARFGTEDELRAAQNQVGQAETNHFIVLDALPQDDITGEDAPASDQSNLSPHMGPVLPDLSIPSFATVVGMIPRAPSAVTMPELPTRLAAVDPDRLPATGEARSDVTTTGVAADVMADTGACTASLDATAGPAALVTLTLAAPCAIDSRATIHHQGVMFTLLTDSAGRAEVTVPALAESAVFIADVSGSDGAMAMVEVPEVAAYDRAVLQWQGASGLELHAREFGADYNTEGHVWKAAARDADIAIESGSGFLVRLGDAAAEEALMAEIYTFPSGTAARDGNVRLTAEIEITAENCGRDISAQSLQVGPGRENSALDLTLTMPGCDATGDFLVLQNMFEDLTLAAK